MESFIMQNKNGKRVWYSCFNCIPKYPVSEEEGTTVCKKEAKTYHSFTEAEQDGWNFSTGIVCPKCAKAMRNLRYENHKA